MALVLMDKMRLFLHRSDAVPVLRALQKLGALEFTDVSGKSGELERGTKTSYEFNYVSSRLDQAIEFLDGYAPTNGKLQSIFEGSRVPVTGTELYETVKSFYYNDIIDTVQTLQKDLSDTTNKIKDLENEQELLLGWRTLDLSLGVPRETEHTKTFFLRIPEERSGAFTKELEKRDFPFRVAHVSEDRYVFSCMKAHATEVAGLFGEYEVELVELPMRRGTPEEELERIGRALIKARATLADIDGKAQELVVDLPKLKMVGDYMFWRKNKHNLLTRAHQSKEVIVFEAWYPKKKREDIEDVIQNKTELYAIEDVGVKEGEVPPVEIENNALIKPFESVTRLYGLPGPKDLDPTLFLAGFFFIFFGLSLTDVGYGILLFLVTAFGLLFYRVPKEMKPFLKLFMFGGIASAIVGLFFGGYLGVDMSKMPTFIQNLQAFDPISNPIPVFYLALALGVVQILAGLVLKIVREAKNGDLWGGVLDQGPWIFLFLSLILWGSASVGVIAGSASVYLYVVYAAIFSLILTQGRKEKNMFGKLFKGVFSLYDSISYLSDILSYSRLLALGLATSALAFAVNLIAGMVKDVPYVGFILMAAILVVGHLFNLAVNVLGAFIHSARLQFVEFFGKFIEGSGRTFKPFKRDERYVAIK